MLLWAGRATRGAATISRLVIPAQTAIRTAAGVCVAMEMEAQRAMPQSLRAGEEYFIRVHSHPCKAFHSDADDANLVLSHNGAISIVVPNFCHNVPTDLTACAVFEYRIGHGWRELDLKERGARFTIV
jgi:proteasome lid subunit RPN8/RPN11